LDLVLGGLLFLGGLFVLANAAFATAASVVFVGWILLIGGILALIGSLFRIGRGGFWSMALTGALLAVLGLVFLRHTGAAVVTLTLVAGVIFLVSGIVRLVVAGSEPEHRAMLIVGGVISTVLGLLVLFNLVAASFLLLGVLLGVQMLTDGLSIMLIGRLHMPAIPRGGPKPAGA